MDEGDEDGDFDERADDGGEGDGGVEAEDGDGVRAFAPGRLQRRNRTVISPDFIFSMISSLMSIPVSGYLAATRP